MSFNDKSIDIVDRLSECADIDEAEGATIEVVELTREAARDIATHRNAISILHAALNHCRDLLAVIHGDDGRYTEEHGVEKSCADAVEKVRALRVAIDEREYNMYLRIREDYDRIVDDAWRAENDRLRDRIARADSVVRMLIPGRPMAPIEWSRAAIEYLLAYEDEAA